MVIEGIEENNMGSTSRTSLAEDDRPNISADKVIQMTRSPRKAPEYKPRSHSPTRLPGGLRVPVIKKPAPRLLPRLEQSLAGLEELKSLREKQYQRIIDAKLITSDHGHPSDTLHMKDKDRIQQGHSHGNLSSISEEDVLGKWKQPDTGTGNEGSSLNGNDDGSSPSRHSHASNDSLDSLDSSESVEKQGGINSIDDSLRKLPASVKEQTSICPDSRNIVQRRASIQCTPQSSRTVSEEKTFQIQRRASFQCEAVLTKSNNETMSKVISEMKLNHNFPSPLHAVMRQYGSSSNITASPLSHTSSSPSAHSRQPDNKNHMDVLRSWQLEKTNITNIKNIPKDQSKLVDQDGIDEVKKEGRDPVTKSQPSGHIPYGNNRKTDAQSLTCDKLISVDMMENITKDTIPDEACENKNAKVNVTVDPPIVNDAVDLLDSMPHFDYEREQSFTSDYYGSIETIHSVQSLPVTRLSSSGYQHQTDMEGSSVRNQSASNVRRHSLPCSRTARQLSAALMSKSRASDHRSCAKTRIFETKMNSAISDLSGNSVDPIPHHQSGCLSCGDSMFGKKRNTARASHDHYIKTKNEHEMSLPVRKTNNKSSRMTGAGHAHGMSTSHGRNSRAPLLARPEAVSNIPSTQNAQVHNREKIPDEGYVDSASSREGSCEDMSGEQPETGNSVVTEQSSHGKSKEKSESQTKEKKRLLETSL